MADSIFRAAALERLSTPEQLDRLARITRPIAWVALTAFFLVCALALVWSAFVSFPVRVPAQGMLVAPEGVMDVMTAHRGRVNILVKPGDTIRSGQPVARLEQPDTSQELQLARMEAAELDEKYAALGSLTGSETRARLQADADRRTGIRQAIAFKRDRIAWLEEKLAQEKDMVLKGFISSQRAVNAQIELNTARSELATLENDLKQLDAAHSSYAISKQRTLMDTDLRRNAARRKAAELQEKLDRQVTLLSPYDAQVAELKVNSGELVESGASLFSVQRSGAVAQSLMAVIYVAPEDGKRIVPGMHVQVSPSTVKRDEYGFMLGKVSRVAVVPSTSEGMMRVLRNRALVEKLAGGGAPFEVWVELERDAASVTGFRWSSFNPLLMKTTQSKGPQISIGSNTLCSAHIAVREKRLITLLIPGLEPLFDASVTTHPAAGS